MSSPQVTLKTLIETWSIIADQKDSNVMIAELETFVEKCKDEAMMSIHDVTAAKAAIIKVWVDPTWELARKRNPHWSNKSWWEKRKGMVDSAFKQVVKDVFDVTSVPKPREVKQEQTVVASTPTAGTKLTNLADIRALKIARAGGSN